ncbi:MAG: VWA domain-containing protein, partial [Microscillaceae bacterium]|nr:VWA domain-containing protein [Microscillaceae bacterium]
MKNFMLLCLFVLVGQVLPAQTPPDRTLSPYFLVKSKDKQTDRMPLKHTAAQVNIAGVIANVIVQQVYVNEGKNPLEAIYVFPGSTRAAVYAMTMTIGERKLVARIEERKKAREQYEAAKEEGKTASLLEQQNPNVFQMNVANILPGDSITVELRYTELLEPTEGTYEFVYPTVVGPRYSETPETQALPHEQWVANPYLHEGENPNYTFGLQTTLTAGMPIQDITCPSHEADIRFTGRSAAQIALKASEKYRGNKDFILKYRLSGGQIQSGVLLYEEEAAVASGDEKSYAGGAEKFFLVMLQPPKLPTLEQIPPREYVFIVDVSGSMHGFPLELTKSLMRDLIGKLRPSDRFNVMLFESSNQMLSPESMPATAANLEKALRVIDQQQGSGGTRLLPALENAFAFKETRAFSRTFVVITDGYVTVEREAFDLIRNRLNEANLFAFGIGSSVNRFLIEGMARVGMGEPFFVTQASEAAGVSARFHQYISQPVLTNIQVKFNGFEAYDIAPQAVPDVFAQRPILIYGKYRGEAKGSITISGLSGQNTYSETIAITKNTAENNQALRYLWARKKIQLLDDYNRLSVSYWGNPSEAEVVQMVESNPDNAQRVREVIELGLKYNLLTAYTSFVAIDTEVRNPDRPLSTVKQPLPLPEGVSDRALGEVVYSKTASRGVMKLAPPRAEKPKKYAHEEAISVDLDVEVQEEVPVLVPTLAEADSLISIEAHYKAGEANLLAFIQQNLVYPASARKKGIQGEVIVEFTIDAQGNLSGF